MSDTRCKRYLHERIVFCANCDANRRLFAMATGLVCETCASSSWMHLPNAASARPASAPSNQGMAMDAMSRAFLGAVQRLSSPGLPVISGI